MIKKIAIKHLRPGMFVHDFNCGWLENPFFSSQAAIKDDAMVQKVLHAGIRELYIDTAKGDDVAEGIEESEVVHQIEAEIEKLSDERRDTRAVPMHLELEGAKKVRHEAKKIITGIMQDVRMGKQVEVEAVEGVVEKMVDSIFRNVGALSSLSRLKSKDEYTFFHSVNVCVLLVAFAKGAGLPRGDILKAGVGALLHDVGKMAVPQEVLNKEGKLTDGEFIAMKEHVVQSRIILAQTPGIDRASLEVAAQHHERYDGSGYPEKLKGEEISQMGRMAAIVDVYDAITSDRCYHKGMGSAEALRKMYEWGKFHFDPALVELFIKTVGIYPVGTMVRLESGLVGVVKEPGLTNMMLPVVKLFYDARKERYISPRDCDLAREKCAGERITGVEQSGKYKIDPLEFIGLI